MLKELENEKMQLAASNAALRREIADVQAKIPRYVPFAGPVPKTQEAFQALPPEWRQQVANEHPDLWKDLLARKIIAENLAGAKKEQAKVKEICKDLPFSSVQEYNALAPKQKRAWAAKMTAEQRTALVTGGQAPMENLL